jgi:gluconate 5-dehydrogenase
LNEVTMSDLFSLAGRVALVTGSARGLGLAMAAALAEHGACVYLNGRDGAALEARRAEFRARGLQAKVAAFDITDEPASDAAIAGIAQAEGRLDILVNNVGPRLRRSIGEISSDGLRGMLDAHVVAPMRMAKQAAELMKPNGYGRIIMVSSVAGLRGLPNDAAYSAAKGAVLSMTRSLAVEFGRFGITCNTLVPGRFLTESNAAVDRPARGPLGRWGDPSEIGGACVFLASPAAAYVTAAALPVDGGVSNTVGS